MRYELGANHRITLRSNDNAHTYSVNFAVHSDALLAVELLQYCKIKEIKKLEPASDNWVHGLNFRSASNAIITDNIIGNSTKPRANNVWKSLKRDPKTGKFTKKRTRLLGGKK